MWKGLRFEPMTQQGSADEEKVPVNSSTSSIHSAAGHSKKFHSIHTVLYYTAAGWGHTGRWDRDRMPENQLSEECRLKKCHLVTPDIRNESQEFQVTRVQIWSKNEVQNYIWSVASLPSLVPFFSANLNPANPVTWYWERANWSAQKLNEFLVEA